jgi:metal-responsive CopG/Arc/MetJ family transcriptional regulator
VKMAISIPDSLLEELDRVRKECRASRSHVITLAIREYLDRMKSHKLLEDLNASFVSDRPAKRKVREKGKGHYAGKVLVSRSAIDHSACSVRRA